jgi:predicted O-methyltransferase YrrM
MGFLSKFQRLLRDPVDLARSLDQRAAALVEGSANQARLINEKSNAIVQGLDNQSRILDDKLDAVIAGLDNQSRLLNMKLDAVIAGLNNQSRLLNTKLDVLIAALDDQSRVLKSDFQPKSRTPAGCAPVCPAETAEAPLLVAEKTYNTSHPNYDVTVARNFPGKILNDKLPCRNPAYAALRTLAKGDAVPDDAWTQVLQDALAEARTVPHADLVLQRREAIDQYMVELDRRYSARYIAGWVNRDDALFLYWLVRTHKPKTIVQCGVCNGLSSAFMVLALAKNGPEGKLYGIDIPPVFNPKDPAWTIAGNVYGFVIPEGKTSGWMVPEAYRDRFEVQNGDAKLLLPKLVDGLPAIDMFYHDSDHTYNHMMFEFREANRKLVPGGLIVADDIAWNAALWDFADEHTVPAYNFRGSVGVTFF